MFLICKTQLYNYKQQKKYKKYINIISNIIKTKIQNIKIVKDNYNRIYINNIQSEIYIQNSFNSLNTTYIILNTLRDHIIFDKQYKIIYNYNNYLNNKSIINNFNNVYYKYTYYNNKKNKIINKKYKNKKYIINDYGYGYRFSIIKCYYKNRLIYKNKFYYRLFYFYKYCKIYYIYKRNLNTGIFKIHFINNIFTTKYNLVYIQL